MYGTRSTACRHPPPTARAGDAVLTWQQLRDLECAELDSAADGWGKAANRADAAQDRVNTHMTAGLAATQEGKAADAAIVRLKDLNRNFAYIHTECGLIRTTLNSLSYELRTPQRNLKDALEEAGTLGFTVNPDGSVSYPAAAPKNGLSLPPGPEAPGGSANGRAYLLEPRPGPNGMLSTPTQGLLNANPNQAKAEDVADRIARALRDANDIDGRFSRTLAKLKAEPGLKVSDATWTDAAQDAAAVREEAHKYLRAEIPDDKSSPAERKAWWTHLTQEQREELLTVYPDVIGNLDGIPSAVRDQANRDNLPLLIGKLEGKDDEASKTMLAGLQAIDAKLQEPSKPPLYLLGVGDQGNGRAILSYGNPDTAKNVSAYVPGLGTKLDASFAGETLKRAQDTALGALDIDQSNNPASIVWLGYDAPQLPAADLMGNLDVMSKENAEVGAPAYNEFMAGISATNEGNAPHVTAIGHSYGSLTVGLAAQENGGIPGADDIILVGSPGTGADSASELGVGKEHVYVGAAENDLVTKLPTENEAGGMGAGAVGGGSAGAVLGLGIGGPVGAVIGGAGGAVVGGIAGYTAQDAQTDPNKIYFGTDPAHKDFGANRFLVDDGPTLTEEPMQAHSNYFDPTKDQKSADNIASIVVGHGDAITRQQPR
ncbi:alpha/beta hydrolase [Streptomyces sp. NPDC091272]|uniref:alpha/beta hydrolase n=1 Tax=Streptomyces sp. NPDC091272 TaxID=3365981 RepID=UPI0037F612D0